MPRKSKAEAVTADTAAAPAPETLTTPPELREPGDDTPKKLPDVEIRGWSVNNAAGVELLTYANRTPDKKRFETWIKFRDGKPSEAVRQIMKEGGFKWHPDVPEAGAFKGEGAWTHPIGYATGAQDRLQGQRVFADVVNQTYKDKGIESNGRDPF